MADFHLFPRLPLELRIRIWKMAVEPREVRVGEQADIIHEGGRTLRSTRRYFNSPTPAPALLHACHESRYICEPLYTKACVYGSQPRYTWVNYDLDTIVVRDLELEQLSDESPFIRWLTVYEEDSPFYPHSWDHLRPSFSLSTLLDFPVLERFVYLSSEMSIRRWDRRLDILEGRLREGRPGGPWPVVNIIMRDPSEPEVEMTLSLEL
jgi:hypothetical protein